VVLTSSSQIFGLLVSCHRAPPSCAEEEEEEEEEETLLNLPKFEITQIRTCCSKIWSSF
jgi:hypothetical protein